MGVRRLGTACAVVVGISGLTVIAGWLFDVAPLTTVLPGLASMKLNTATCLALLALTITVDRAGIVRAACTAVLLIAGLTLFEYATGWSLGIDELIVDDPGPVGTMPGRMAISTALCLVTLAAGRLLVAAGRRRSAETALLAAGVIGAVAALGYLYGVRALYSVGSFSTMAVHTAVGVLLLSAAALTRVPDGRVSWLVYGTDPGSALLRRMMPVAFLVLPLVGLIRLRGEQAELYTTPFGLAIMVVIAAIVIVVVSFRAAQHLQSMDRRRSAALAELRALNQELETLVDRRSRALAEQQSTVAVYQDRGRIAQAMYDTVLRRVYTSSMRLAGALQDMPDGAPGSRAVHEVVDELDRVIEETRGTIFSLSNDRYGPDTEESVLRLTDDAERRLGFPPSLALRGSMAELGRPESEALLAVLEQWLTHLADRAAAATVTVDISTEAGWLTLEIADNGPGLPKQRGGAHGPVGIRERAEALGGTAAWSSTPGGGTRVTWRVPTMGRPVPVPLEQAGR